MQADALATGDWLMPGPGACRLLLLVLLVNAMVSVLAAVLAIALSPRRIRGPWLRDFTALLGMGLLVPLAGPVLMLFQLALLSRLSQRHTSSDAELLPLSPYVPDDPRPLVFFGTGGAVQGLRNSSLGEDKSIRALLAVEQQRSAQTSQLLFDTLGHPNESVRLTAAGLLDRRESRVLRMMRRVELLLEDEARLGAGRTARLHLEAARLNAEMLYLRLARDGMGRLYLERWGRHLDASQALCEGMAEWMLSKARWLEQNRFDGAEELFQRALYSGASPSRTVPYLAERYWQRRDYDGLRELMAQHHLFTGLPTVGALGRRWGGTA